MVEWRWIDNEDGTHVLVEGEGLLPVARVVLMCGNVESGDQDRIARVPVLEDACRMMERFLAQEVPDGDGTCPLSERLAALGGAMAHARVMAALAWSRRA